MTITARLGLSLLAITMSASPPADGPMPFPGSESPVVSATVLAEGKALTIPKALVEGEHLWVPMEQVAAMNGFEPKPQGLCSADICIPMPQDPGWVIERAGEKFFAVTWFADKIKQVVAAEPNERVWSISKPLLAQKPVLANGKAPDFVVSDRDGNPVRLSDFRGKKVLVLTWASW